ncbi:MAG: hypothetical protein WCK43_00625 [bacterium]
MKKNSLLLFGLSLLFISTTQAREIYYYKCGIGISQNDNIEVATVVIGYGKKVNQAINNAIKNCKEKYEEENPGMCEEAAADYSNRSCENGIYIPFKDKE